jgi:hypothetical protein
VETRAYQFNNLSRGGYLTLRMLLIDNSQFYGTADLACCLEKYCTRLAVYGMIIETRVR